MRWLALLLVLSATELAAARPSVQLAIAGECPASAQLSEALSKWVDVVDDAPEWTVRVVGTSAWAELALRDRSGALALSRRVLSPDCAARADAFAVMIHAHFVELRVLPLPEPEPEPAPELPSVAPPPSVTDISPASAATQTDVVPPAAATRAANITPPRREAAIAVSGGVGLAGMDATVSGFGELEGTLFGSSWLAFAAVAVSAPTSVGSAMERIEQWPMTTRLGVARRFDLGSLWLQPALGAGVALWRVEPLDLPSAAPRWSAQPIGTAGTILGIPVASWLSVRLETRATVFLDRDRYLIDPQGEIARSPRGAIGVGVGLEFGRNQ